MTLIKRTLRNFIYLIAGLAAGIALFLIFIAWQFSKGPIPLGFLNPYIEAAINQGNRDVVIRMGETILTWAGWERALDIRVLEVQVVDQAGVKFGSIPEVAFSISGDALVRGKLAPKSIELFGPSLRFRRDRDGGINVGFVTRDSNSENFALGLIDKVLEQGHSNDSLSYLTHVAVIGADITITDQVYNKSWHMPAANLNIERFIDRFKGAMSLVLDVGEEHTNFDFSGEYLTQSQEIELRVKFNRASPSMFAGVISGFEPLKHIEMPLSGEISLSMPINDEIDRVGISVKGSHGKLHLPKPFAQTLAVEAIEIKASYNGDENSGNIDKLKVQLSPDSTVMLPEPLSHNLPLSSFDLKANFEEDGAKFSISRFIADLGGPKLELNGRLDGIEEPSIPLEIEIIANLSNTPVAMLPLIWPKNTISDARDWVLQHVSEGYLKRANVSAKFRTDPSDGLLVDKLVGDMSVRNVVVDYLPPLPAVTVAAARMEFDESTYTIHLEKARADQLTVRKGSVALTGLDRFDQFADIDLVIDGLVADQLDFINQEPLQLLSTMGINPSQTGGMASTHLKLFFILQRNLQWKDIQVWAHSRLKNFSMTRAYKGKGVTNAQLDLRVDKRGLDVSGTGYLERIPATINWRENFIDTSEFRSRYVIKAAVDDLEYIRELDVQIGTLFRDFIRGEIKAKLQFTVLDEVDSRLRITADLTDTILSAPAFGWSKPKGIGGRGELILNMAKNQIVGAPQFNLTAGDLNIRGTANYALDGHGLERIDFSEIVYGRTQMAGSLMPRGNGSWDGGFHGDSFDLSPMWEDVLGQMSGGDEFENTLLEGLTLAVEIKKVWLDEKTALNDVSGTFARGKETWRTVLLNANISKNADFKLTIRPDVNGNRKLEMGSKNAGKVLKFLELYENMLGGELKVAGNFNDALPERPLKGEITIRDYRIVNAPALARLLSIMALTGILEALEGEGLAFTDLAAPFELKQGTFKIKEARASGPSLGYTAKGKVFRDTDIVDLEGTLIPAYALNSVFGHIPLLGDIFTGGEKGGGMFAATYTMTGPIDEPVILVNPLSALAPGILRNVFGIIGQSRSRRSILEEEAPTPALQ